MNKISNKIKDAEVALEKLIAKKKKLQQFEKLLFSLWNNTEDKKLKDKYNIEYKENYNNIKALNKRIVLLKLDILELKTGGKYE